MPTNRRSLRRAILTSTILPATLITTAMAVDTPVPPNLTINSDTGAPLFSEGLIEGRLDEPDGIGGFNGDNEVTPNPNNSSPELGLRMATINQGDPPGDGGTNGDPGFPDGWRNGSTWVYTGQINTGPNGIISLAANNDDGDWFRINGAVVLNDNAWDTAAAATVTGLTPNTWVDFEYRVSDFGGGGAGPSGQNPGGATGWTGTVGAVISHDNEGNSLAAGNYTFGLGGVGSYEPAGGGPTLFRYQSGFVFTDDIRVTATGTVTIDGTNPSVTEPSLTFDNAAPAILTVNDGTGSHKTLSISGVTSLATATAHTITINGSTDITPGQITDGSASGTTLNYAGTGTFTISNTANDLNGTALTVTSGTVSVIGDTGASPISTLTTPITLAGGTLRVGSLGGGTTFNNAVNVTGNATLQHTVGTTDTLGSAGNGMTIAAGQTLNLDVTSGQLNLGGAVSGASATLNKTGGGSTTISGATSLNNLSVTAGRLQIEGAANLTNVPTLTGGTLSLRNGGNTIAGGAAIPVPGGATLEAVPGGAGAANQLNLTGGTLSLISNAATNGLNGEFFNVLPNNINNSNPDWGLGGLNAPINVAAFLNHYNVTLPGIQAPINAASSANGNTAINFPSTDPANPFNGLNPALNFGNDIQARFTGKFLATTAGVYTFGTTSDDGSVILMDGIAVNNNNNYQGMTRRDGTIFLLPGVHDIQIGFYEGGGGAGLIAHFATPGGPDQILPNTALSQSGGGATFGNPINVTANSTINTNAGIAVVPSLTVAPGLTTTLGVGLLQSTATNLTGPGTFTTAGNGSLALGALTTGAGDDVDIVQNSTGSLIFNNPASPTLQGAGSTVTVNSGTLGLVLGGANNPTGTAAVTLGTGTSVALSSAGGNQAYALPNTLTNGSVLAGKLGNGVPGPVTVSVTGTLNAGPTQKVDLGTGDGYTLNMTGAAINIDGGTLRILGGTVDVGSVVAATPFNANSVVNRLQGRFINNGPGDFLPSVLPGNTEASIKTIIRQVGANVDLADLNGALNFGNDGAFDALFDPPPGPGAITDQRYTAAFSGFLTVPAGQSGTWNFQLFAVDDTAATWVDLNQNGLFELNGSSGNERMIDRGCCGDSGVGGATLVAGQTYQFALAVEDTGGGGSVIGRFQRPAGSMIDINPGDGGQVGMWSSFEPTGGATAEILTGGELRTRTLTNVRDAHVNGTLRLNNPSPTVFTLESVRNSLNGTLTLDAGNDLNAAHFTVAPGTTFVKNGAGTFTATTQSLGAGGTFRVEAGVANLNGLASTLASNGAANSGNIVVQGTGRVNVNGSITGTVTANSGGTLGGNGTVGATTINSGAFLAPGTSVGTLTTGNLTLAGALEEEVLSQASYDITNVNGSLDLNGSTLSLALLNPAQLVAGDKLFILRNDGGDPVNGTFNGLADNATIQIGSTIFQITYDADFGTLGVDGGNDVALLVNVPEPGSLTALLGGVGLLASLRRFRRRA